MISSLLVRHLETNARALRMGAEVLLTAPRALVDDGEPGGARSSRAEGCFLDRRE